jgi:hypothetical protein
VIGANDAKLHADLVYRSGAVDRVLGSVDSAPQMGSFKLASWIQDNVCADALSPQPGDALILKVTYNGSQDASVIETSLTLP